MFSHVEIFFELYYINGSWPHNHDRHNNLLKNTCSPRNKSKYVIPDKKSQFLFPEKRIMERQMASDLFEKERAFDTICVNYSFHDQQRSYR